MTTERMTKRRYELLVGALGYAEAMWEQGDLGEEDSPENEQAQEDLLAVLRICQRKWGHLDEVTA